MFIKNALRQQVNRVLHKQHFSFERIPEDHTDATALPLSFFEQRLPCHGIDFRAASQLQWLQEGIIPREPHFAQWNVLRKPDPQCQYYLGNDYFGPVDAETYYAMIQHYRPKRIIEIGSGFSTHVAHAAIHDAQLDTRMTCIDPNPRTCLDGVAHDHWQRIVQTVPVKEFANLEPNDILFIDSSHRIETGGDVPYLYLEVLPKLVQGVIVHIHDIHLPRNYPRLWATVGLLSYNEQYLVALMLNQSPHWQVLWSSAWMQENHPDAIKNAFPSIQRVREAFPERPTIPAIPGSLWLKKISPAV